MITVEEAKAADQLWKDCSDLQKSAAFQRVMVAELEKLKEDHERRGTDLSKKPRVRAEHHQAFHMAKDLLKLIADKKKEATDILEQWKAQHGEKSALLPDRRNL